MNVLDLYCCSGGASVGISRLGHTVEGVDIDENLLGHYPYKIIIGDALRILKNILEVQSEYNYCPYDAFWASPPCQNYSYATSQWKNLGREYPDLVAETRALLLQIGKPFVLENVPNAPLRKDLILCMSMFDDGRKFMVRRHRVFEIHGFTVPQPKHTTHKGRVGDGRIISVFGHGGGARYNHATSKIADWQIAMGINWTKNRKYLAEAIPPEYSNYIFSFLKEKE